MQSSAIWTIYVHSRLRHSFGGSFEWSLFYPWYGSCLVGLACPAVRSKWSMQGLICSNRSMSALVTSLAVVTSVVVAQIGGRLKVPVGIPILGKSHCATIAMMHPGAMQTSSTAVELALGCHPVANQSGTIHGISTNSTTRSRCGRASLLPCRLTFYVFFAKFL